jgi:hypothetical protein
MPTAVTARHGQKMIEVRVRFWTNDLAPKPGMVLPKEAWASRVVLMDANSAHKIAPQEPLPFSTLLELPGTIERVLIRHGIRLHRSTKMLKYLG